MTPASTPCPRCGHPAAAGLRFCTECGLNLAVAPPPVGPRPAADETLTRPPPPARPICPGCGQPVASPGLRYCTNCGAPTGNVAPPPQGAPYVAPQAPAAHTTTSRIRSPWPWLAVAVVVLLLAVGGAGYLLTRDDGGSGSTQVAQDTGTGQGVDTGSDGAAGSDSTSAEAGDPDGADDSGDPDGADDSGDDTSASSAPVPSPSPPPSVAPVGANCWNGTIASSVDLCSRPQGPAGVEWVYPSLSGQSCSNLSGSGKAPGRKVLIQCFADLADGTRIKLNYSQWGAVTNAIEHYTGKGMSQSGDGSGYRFDGVSDDGLLNVAVLYQKEPFSISVYAATSAQVEEALGSLVQSRPEGQLRGVPLG